MDVALLFDHFFTVEGSVAVEAAFEQGADKVFVLALDPTVRRLVAHPRTIFVDLALLEQRYPQLDRAKDDRTWAAYTQTLKPFWAHYLLMQGHSRSLCHIDSDVCFVGPVKAVAEELGDDAFLGTPRADRGGDRPITGWCNGGVFACRHDLRALSFLGWWQEQCAAWCKWESGPDGRYTEEGYLDVVGDPRWPGTKVSTHPGINHAPWWSAKRHLAEDKGKVLVDGHPIICYHFQGFQRKLQAFTDTRNVTALERELLYKPYFNRLVAEQSRQCYSAGVPTRNTDV